jgi:microcompartment protein CcmL/EutN
MSASELGSLLNVLIGGTFVAVVTAIVAAIRKIKSGNIVDDDAVIARLDSDNVKIRKERDEAVAALEVERRARWRAEDIAALYKRQLTDGKIEPATVGESTKEPDSERT